MISKGSNEIQTGNKVETGGYTYYANLDLQYKPDGYFHDGLVKALDNDGGTVFLNNAGELAFKVQSTYTVPDGNGFNDGLQVVKCDTEGDSADLNEILNKSYGYINKTGELAIPCAFAAASDFKNGYAVVSRITVTEEIIDPSSFVQEHDEKGNLIQKDSTPIQETIVQSGVIDTSGNFVVDYQSNNINAFTTTFKDGIYEAYDPNTAMTYCFNLKGENLGELNSETGSCYGETAESDAESKAESEAKKTIASELSEGYRIGNFSEGIALVYSTNSSERYFVNTNGDTLWTVDATKIISMDDRYYEGLVFATIWDSEDPFPGVEAINNNEVPTDDLVKNMALVYYDRQGQIVFKYKYGNFESNFNDINEE